MNPVGYLETGVLHCEDNLHALARFPADCVDLIYLDPPFFSNKNYEVIWGDEAEVRSFEDRWEGGIQVYIEWMEARVRHLHRVLKPTGSVYLHCDWHASHYLKVMLDDLFGYGNFLNNIVWCYGLGGSSKRYWPRKHDDILWYSKERDGHYFEAARVPATSQRMKGRDKKAPDYWEIPTLNNMARERLGYPTQKPEALLERIIGSTSKPGDIVLDPFCGCGTTVAVAQRLGRQWIGIDISPQAVEIMKLRLNKLGASPAIQGLPTSVDELRQLGPFEFQHWIIQRVMGNPSPRKSGDMGIDGYSFFEQLPIQIKQRERVGRNDIDNFETAIARDGKHKGYFVAFSFTRTAYEEVARARRSGGPEVALVTVEDIVRVGELIDSADREGRTPDLFSVTPDLMGLFSALQRAAPDRPLYPAPSEGTKPSAQDLIRSARERRGVEHA